MYPWWITTLPLACLRFFGEAVPISVSSYNPTCRVPPHGSLEWQHLEWQHILRRMLELGGSSVFVGCKTVGQIQYTGPQLPVPMSPLPTPRRGSPASRAVFNSTVCMFAQLTYCLSQYDCSCYCSGRHVDTLDVSSPFGPYRSMEDCQNYGPFLGP